MSIERTIVHKLFESKGLYEASFESGGSTYRCVFGRYYKDDEEITREDYFKAKDGGSVKGKSAESDKSKTPTKSESIFSKYDKFKKEDFDKEMDEIEDTISELYEELPRTAYEDRYEARNSISDRFEELNDRLSTMEEYLTDEQFDRMSALLDKTKESSWDEVEVDDGNPYENY